MFSPKSHSQTSTNSTRITGFLIPISDTVTHNYTASQIATRVNELYVENSPHEKDKNRKTLPEQAERAGIAREHFCLFHHRMVDQRSRKQKLLNW